MRSSDGLVGCPGAGAKPAEVYPASDRPSGGKAVCSRCGNLYALRADGRIRAHRVTPAAIVPMIRRQLDPAGRLRGRRT